MRSRYLVKFSTAGGRNFSCTRAVVRTERGGDLNCKAYWTLAFAGAMSITSLAVCKAQAQADLPQGPGRAVVERMCTSCHGLNVVTAQRMTKKAWAAQVDDMVSRGAIGSADDIRQVVDYLAANFGKGQSRQASNLPSRRARRRACRKPRDKSHP